MADTPPPQSPNVDLAISVDDYYDSGWVSLAAGTCKEIFHNLGGDPNDYAVESLFLSEEEAGLGRHRRGYGGLDLDGNMAGAHWQNLRSDRITVCRGSKNDDVDKVRVRVFVPVGSGARWDSGWRSVTPGKEETFKHRLAIPPTDLTVSLWFRDSSIGGLGIHQYGYGGITTEVPRRMMRGAAWHHLNNEAVEIYVFPDEGIIDEVRVIVAQTDPPAYDSASGSGPWTPLTPGMPVVLTHNLDWNPDMLLIRAECKQLDVEGWGIHHLFAGGNVAPWLGGRKGANMQRLGRSTVELFRWEDDVTCPLGRVRIWKRTARVYVPLVVYNDG
jgi:hypothetical protein